MVNGNRVHLTEPAWSFFFIMGKDRPGISLESLFLMQEGTLVNVRELLSPFCVDGTPCTFHRKQVDTFWEPIWPDDFLRRHDDDSPADVLISAVSVGPAGGHAHAPDDAHVRADVRSVHGEFARAWQPPSRAAADVLSL